VAGVRIVDDLAQPDGAAAVVFPTIAEDGTSAVLYQSPVTPLGL